MRNSRRRDGACVAALLVALASFGPASAEDADEPSVTPYRPTVSNPADLPAPGWLEGEFGGARTFGEGASRSDAVPWLLKYAFDDDHGLLVGGDAYVHERVTGLRADDGVGDTFVEWKQRFKVAEHAAFGIEAGVALPTAGAGLGIGTPQTLVNGIFSAGIAAAHVDVNLGFTHGGEQPAGASRWQSSWASAISLPIAQDFSAAFELSGTHQRGAPTQSQSLLAFAWNVSHRLALDAGASYGLTRNAHDRTLFAGATVLIGRLR